MVDREAMARSYYRALDEDDYGTLADLLAPEFVHYRPDRTIEGRDRFVRFMRDERPMKATSHPVDAVYATGAARSGRGDDGDSNGGESSDGGGAGNGDSGTGEVAVRGRLLDPDGDPVVSFVDVFSFADGAVETIHTYTQ